MSVTTCRRRQAFTSATGWRCLPNPASPSRWQQKTSADEIRPIWATWAAFDNPYGTPRRSFDLRHRRLMKRLDDEERKTLDAIRQLFTRWQTADK
jgi:hypothetical protein